MPPRGDDDDDDDDDECENDAQSFILIYSSIASRC